MQVGRSAGMVSVLILLAGGTRRGTRGGTREGTQLSYISHVIHVHIMIVWNEVMTFKP